MIPGYETIIIAIWQGEIIIIAIVIAYTILYISGRDTPTFTAACMMIVRAVLYLLP
jgi:cytochrome c oxidase assembly factor CtaG